ncbi:hypothetical protein DFS34DRAFT_517192 [Phlyctochytrium arcticum]|nr:hypothetical protein DFS34DRAFT_517192 [Phlyctochytrium arcticum]
MGVGYKEGGNEGIFHNSTFFPTVCFYMVLLGTRGCEVIRVRVRVCMGYVHSHAALMNESVFFFRLAENEKMKMNPIKIWLVSVVVVVVVVVWGLIPRIINQ